MVAMVAKQKLLYQLKFFETLKDTPNPSKGFRFVAFLVLEILRGPFRPPPPLVLGVGTKTLGVRRIKGSLCGCTIDHYTEDGGPTEV